RLVRLRRQLRCHRGCRKLMPRYRNQLGSVVNLPEDKAARLGSGWELLGAPAPSGSPASCGAEPVVVGDEPDGNDSVDYSSLKVAELRGHIEARNADRPEDGRLSTVGKKADLVDRLIGDDA